MRAPDTGEHTDMTHLAAWQIDLGSWRVSDSDSSGRLSWLHGSVCVWDKVMEEVRKDSEKRKRIRWEGGADDEEEKHSKAALER